MATVNRFTQIEPAKYNPRSLQELMMVPAYKRQQHTATEEQLAAAETALAQVDPLAVHSDLAKMEQQKLYDQITAQSEQLANKGFTSTSKSDVIRLNKQYQQAISPTGKLGQINAAKKVYAKNLQDYIEDATKNKKWSREDAIRNWNKFEKDNYTGFDPQGNISNISQYGAPEKIELAQKLKDVKALLGEQVVKELTAGKSQFARQPDGSLMVVDRSGRRIETSNAPNIQSAMVMLASELSDPNSAWNKSIKFEGIDPVKFEEQLTGGLNAMITNKVVDNRKESINFTGVKNLNDIEPDNPNVPAVTEPVMEFNNTRDSLSTTLNLIGTNKVGQSGTTSGMPAISSHGPAGFRMEDKTGSTQKYSEKDLSSAQVEQYGTIYKAMINSGILPKTSAKYSTEANKAIKKYLDDTASFSFSNKILKPTAIDNDLQKPLIFTPKKGYDMSGHILQEVESGRRKLYDKITQKEIDVKGKGYTFDYVGMVSPDNVLQINSNTTLNKASLVIPHVVQIKDPDGKITEVYMDRDAEEMKKPEFQASSIIKEALFNAKTALGMQNIISNPSLESRGIKGMELLYKPSNDSYDVKFTDIYGNTTEGKGLSSSQIQNQVYRLYAPKQ